MSQKLTLVLMAGLSGAGKSKIARALRKELQWYLIDKDKYRIKFLRRGFDADKASYNAYEKAFNKVRRVLTERKSSVILDCVGLHDFIINNVMDIVHSVENVELKVILCVVDPGLRKDRLSKRPPQREDLCKDLKTDDDYFKIYKLKDLKTDDDYFKIYKLPKEDEGTYVLHTDKPLRECLDKVKKHLGVVDHTNTTTSTAVEEYLDESKNHMGAVPYALSQT
jgi:predicted kinase